VALLAVAAGFGQFGAVAALGSVAKAFGHVAHGASFADQAGLSGTELGVGLAILRLASLGSLPLAGLADRYGRRAVLVGTCALGLLCTMAAAASPGFWWFVAIFAVGRPLLSATNGLSSVAAVELTSSAARAKAVALMAAGYALGAGATAVINAQLKSSLGFRGVFALAVVPLAFVPLIRRMLVEPDRYRLLTAADHQPPVIGPVEPAYRRRLLLVATLAFAVSVITGPANSLAFIYAQNVLHLEGAVVTAMVVVAGVAGLGGLLLGRHLADTLGRRPTVAIAMVAIAAAGTLTYSGSKWALVVGYVAGVTSGGLFAPAGGALANELFPTQVRASVTGWNIAAGVLGAVVGLVVFGALADVSGVADHARFAALLTFWPVVPAAGVLWFLPETRGLEPEDLDAAATGATGRRGPTRRN
jgi:AAHS family cis,cis-muconate transporter-like MFS transporter